MVYPVLLSTLVKCMVFCGFLFESAPKHLQVRMASVCVSSSTCAERVGGQIHRFSPSANLSHKWLVFCRNYCVEFSLFISALFTRAHHSNFALFAFTTFTERDQKNVGVFLKNVQRFSFFLRHFPKNVGLFWIFFPRF